MYYISVVFLSIGLASIINATDDSCGVQHENSFFCTMNLENSTELKVILEAKRHVCDDICLPDFPKNCTEDWKTVVSCYTELTTRANLLTDDPELAALANKTRNAIDKCFETEPVSPLTELRMLVIPNVLNLEEPKGNYQDTNKSEGTAGDEKKSNGTTKKDNEDGKSASLPPELQFRKECQETPEQMQCVKTELAKVGGKDEKISKAFESLLKKKRQCDTKVKYQCLLSTPELEMCFSSAHEQLRMKILEKMATCTKEKKVDGAASKRKSEKENKESAKKNSVKHAPTRHS